MSASLSQQIARQQEKIAQTKKRLAELKAKNKAAETRRFQKIATKVGWFDMDVELTDDIIETGLRDILDAARSQRSPSDSN